MTPIPLYGSDRAPLDDVAYALAAAGFPFQSQPSWRAFVEAAQTADVSVLVTRRLADLGDLCGNKPPTSWSPPGLIIITEPQSDNLRRSGTLPAAGILFLGEGLRCLPPLVENLLCRDCFARWTAMVRRCPDLPPLLRRVLIAVFEQKPSVAPLEPGDPAAISRSVRSLAVRLGCSEDHLGRTARHAGIDLPGILKWAAALRALQARVQSGASWEVIAWQLGFASVSGLSELMMSTLGVRPTTVATCHVGPWLSEFEHRFLHSLVEHKPQKL